MGLRRDNGGRHDQILYHFSVNYIIIFDLGLRERTKKTLANGAYAKLEAVAG